MGRLVRHDGQEMMFLYKHYAHQGEYGTDDGFVSPFLARGDADLSTGNDKTPAASYVDKVNSSLSARGFAPALSPYDEDTCFVDRSGSVTIWVDSISSQRSFYGRRRLGKSRLGRCMYTNPTRGYSP